jgi:hypothetical protein
VRVKTKDFIKPLAGGSKGLSSRAEVRVRVRGEGEGKGGVWV